MIIDVANITHIFCYILHEKAREIFLNRWFTWQPIRATLACKEGEKMPNEINVGMVRHVELIEELARLVRDSGFKFDYIVAIPKGGNMIGDTLARLFRVPIGYLPSEQYDPNTHEQRTNIVFSRSLASTAPGMGRRVLVVDELDQSGKTLRETLKWLEAKCPGIEEIRTAVLFHKACSTFEPDIVVENVPFDKGGECPWIVFWYERYEHMTPEDL